MLNRLYVDNYKCLVNFEWKPGPASMHVVLGTNGTGKSTLLEVLSLLRSFIIGEGTTDELFPASSLTRWQSVPKQTFGLDWEQNNSLYTYNMSVEHDVEQKMNRVIREQLSQDGKPLFNFEKGEVHLFRDNHSSGPTYTFDWTRSGLAFIMPRPDNKKLTLFKEFLRKIIVVHIIPPMFQAESNSEAPYPSRHFENFISWYRWISQDQGLSVQLQEEMAQVMDGFAHFKFEPWGPENRRLKIVFNPKGIGTSEIDFSNLSDGQKMLITLYALLFSLKANLGTKTELSANVAPPLLCIDEPDNFVALREIQPWLKALEESLDELGARAVLVTHHPEIINYKPMGASSPSTYWFDRPDGRHVRVKDVLPNDNDDLLLSERIARGWQ